MHILYSRQMNLIQTDKNHIPGQRKRKQLEVRRRPRDFLSVYPQSKTVLSFIPRWVPCYFREMAAQFTHSSAKCWKQVPSGYVFIPKVEARHGSEATTASELGPQRHSNNTPITFKPQGTALSARRYLPQHFETNW